MSTETPPDSIRLAWPLLLDAVTAHDVDRMRYAVEKACNMLEPHVTDTPHRAPATDVGNVEGC